MALHRDIYWLGRQWAVTGYGIQAVDKKLNMQFDVEAPRIWQENLSEPMLALDWFDVEDFKRAVGVAQQILQETPARFRSAPEGEK